MKTHIVITSIFPPTEAIEKFSALEDFQLTVVGDKKTPEGWNYPNVNYLSIADQENSGFSLAKILPYNHYCRKMIGYLHAIKNKANRIIDTDDDNIPYDSWHFPDLEASQDHLNENLGFINIYQLFTEQKIWPRGLPLKLITTKYSLEEAVNEKKSNVGVWQGLADEDPDVDAIYRLTSDEPCYFNKRKPVVLSKGTLCPYNSQNTMYRQELFSLLYLPTYVTFRFTDILRGLVAQPIMWLYGYHLGFTEATVIQKRNPHDYLKDFMSEVPMFEYTETVIELVKSAISSDRSINENLRLAYQSLLNNGIVEQRELDTLDAWINDVENFKLK
ncbi:STELLO glycosyltransferase family protein [Pedobacter endophyticus]|uniref:DUF288 domain-containing protein n=1 Tax=Pedobacter endophyticus TaxID=2789740 RepID=A0A7U3Q4B3_9SPHI|nr:STELLO glycosyltransferase family protein [Pedobacter endophyticus]QPH38356.1 DUF288 domain-containing protein [Pedobacter endophyticus]